jgi:hypothetical protein
MEAMPQAMACWIYRKEFTLPKKSYNTKFKKQLNQKTPLSTTQIFNKTILT